MMQSLAGYWKALSSYSIDDLVMFSPQAYSSMVQAYSMQYWPWQQVAALAGLLLLVMLVCRASAYAHTLVLALLAAGCAWVAWSFFGHHYASLHWAAHRFAGLFYAQAALLFLAAVLALRLPPAQLETGPVKAGRAVLLWVCLLAPTLSWFLHGSVYQLQWVGVMPEATALAVLAASLMCRKAAGIPLFLLAAIWLAYSGALAWAMV